LRPSHVSREVRDVVGSRPPAAAEEVREVIGGLHPTM